MRTIVGWMTPILLTATVASFAFRAQAQDEEAPREWAQWDQVQRFVGIARLEDNGALDYTEVNRDDHSRERSVDSVTFELERQEPDSYAGFTIWNATRARVEGWEESSGSRDTNTSRQRYSESGSFAAQLDDPEQVHLTLDHETGEWQFSFPENVPPYTTTQQSSEWTSATNRTVRTTQMITHTSVPSGVIDGAAERKIGTLDGRYDFEFREEDGSGGHTTHARVMLLPDWTDLELIVTLEGHDADGAVQPFVEWRPLGSMKAPGTRGNYVVADAVLRPKEGVSLDPLPEVEQFRFELVGTSREPGVAMNWPLEAKADDEAPDMRLVLTREAGQVDGDGQTALIPQPRRDVNGQPTASVEIDSFDFGGITELKVVAELEDGREVYGKLDLGGTLYSEILVPKRMQGGWVADAWREEKGVSNLFDDNDSEDQPAGDGDDGDGFTLYEEYRGFAARRMRHGRVEGDPKRKDFFILNLIGSDAWAGIQLFEDATGLRVVHRLEPAEMSEEKRLMNGNHADAPHVTDQHGVVLKTQTAAEIGHNGAQAMGFDPDYPKALKPRTTRLVAMPARDDPESDFNRPWNLFASDFEHSYDTMVVHELLHSISVAHHGEDDFNATFMYLPAAYKRNSTGAPVLWGISDGGSAFAEVVEEATKVRWTDRIGPAFDEILARLTAAYVAAAGLPATTSFADLDEPQQWDLIAELPSFYWYVGIEHGQHSGDEFCPMRYQFAELYPAKRFGAGPPGFQPRARLIFYLVPQNSEHHGSKLCTSPEGTGVNEDDWDPEPRYGNAAAKRGDCVEQICITDATEEHEWGLRR